MAPPSHRTHEVANQASPLQGRNLFDDNVALVEALTRECAGWALERAREAGAAWGGAPLRWGFEANEHPPRLKAFDRYGTLPAAVDCAAIVARHTPPAA